MRSRQYVGDIKDSLQFGTPERKVAEEAYGAIRGTIIKQAPEYAKIMKDYEQASGLLDELTKTLSLGRKASEDTSLRKLLSTTRSNVNTNFGKRSDLAKELGKSDPDAPALLAGQSLSPGPHRAWAKGSAGYGAAGRRLCSNPAVLAGASLHVAAHHGRGCRMVLGLAAGKNSRLAARKIVGRIDPTCAQATRLDGRPQAGKTGGGNASTN